MVGQQFTVGLRGLLKPEVDDRARRDAVSEIENDLEEVEQLEPQVDNAEMTGDLTRGGGGAFAGAVPGDRGGPAADLERGAVEGGGGAGVGGAVAGEAVGSALEGVSKVGGMMKVALGGAVAAGILGGVQQAAQASPYMRSQMEMFSTAMSLFFRPVGDMMGRYFQPFALGALQMASRFVEISNEDGLMVGVQYIASETGERTGELATDEEAGAGRILGGLGGLLAGAAGGAKAGAAIGSFFGPGPGTAGGAILGGAVGGLGGLLAGSKVGGDIQEAADVDIPVGNILDEENVVGAGLGTGLGAGLGVAGGAKAGAIAGGTLGSVVPGVGTAAGGIAGAAIGGLGGGLLGGAGGGILGGVTGGKVQQAFEDAGAAVMDKLNGFEFPELPSLSGLDWPELPSLRDMAWPALPALAALAWPSLPNLAALAWPALPSLYSLDWPSLPSLASMSWPSLPSLSSLEWPELPDLSIGGGNSGGGDNGGFLGIGAEGGIVDQPTLSVIGEAGPEAVVPLDRMGSPLPRATGGGAGSGGAEVDLSPVENKIDDLIREVRASGGDVVLRVGEKELARAVDDSITKHESGTQVLK